MTAFFEVNNSLLGFYNNSKYWSNKIKAMPSQKDTEQANNTFLSFFAMK